MSEHADKYNSSHRKERVEHVLNSTKSGKVDASGYEVPGELHTEEKTGPCQPKPRAFAKGGKVEGHKAHHHAGRKSRDAGGAANENSKWNTPETAKRASELRAMYAKSNAAYAKMTPEQQRAHTASYAPKVTKHGPVDTRGDWKNGGRTHRGTGGQTAVQQLRPNVPTGGLYGSGFQPTHAGMLSNAAGLKKGGIANEVTGVRITGDRKARADGGKAQRHNGESKAEYRIDEQDRKARAEGGRAGKGKTNINIIIGGPKEDKPPMGPPMGPPMPPPGRPPIPPGAMGAMQPPGMGGGPAGAGGPPPAMPPGGMPPR